MDWEICRGMCRSGELRITIVRKLREVVGTCTSTGSTMFDFVLSLTCFVVIFKVLFVDVLRFKLVMKRFTSVFPDLGYEVVMETNQK